MKLNLKLNHLLIIAKDNITDIKHSEESYFHSPPIEQ